MHTHEHILQYLNETFFCSGLDGEPHSNEEGASRD